MKLEWEQDAYWQEGLTTRIKIPFVDICGKVHPSGQIYSVSIIVHHGSYQENYTTNTLKSAKVLCEQKMEEMIQNIFISCFKLLEE